MKRFRMPIILAMLLMTNACFIDPFGFFATTDIEKRFQESQSLPDKTNYTIGDPFNFIVITDTHIYGELNRNIIRLTNRFIPSDAFILVCGDLVQNGDDRDYAILEEQLEMTGLTYLTTPGNHDLYYGGWYHYQKYFGRNCYSISIDNVRLISIDSASGSIGRSQREWLENVLALKTEEHTIVFTHYHFFNPFLTESQQYTDIEEVYYLMDLFETSEVDLVLMGHSHQNQTHTVNGVKYINLADFVDNGTTAYYGRISVSNDQLIWKRYELSLPE